jgi:hypothetical protein
MVEMASVWSQKKSEILFCAKTRASKRLASSTAAVKVVALQVALESEYPPSTQ